MPDTATVLEGSAKALLYASLLLAVGASAARWLLLPRSNTGPSIERSAARIALAAALGAAAATLGRVWTHTVMAFGFDGARSWDTLRMIALQSRWGKGWEPQMIAALILVLACALTVWSRAWWAPATIATVLFTCAIPLLGHASGSAGRIVIHVLHMLAGGVWLGTLGVVLLIPMAAETRLRILSRFSPIALSGAAVVVSAGLLATWFYLEAISNLWTTGYGRLLLAKALLVAVIAACGYVNWQRLRKFRDKSSSIIVLEAALAAAVAILTGFLTETGHP